MKPLRENTNNDPQLINVKYTEDEKLEGSTKSAYRNELELQFSSLENSEMNAPKLFENSDIDTATLNKLEGFESENTNTNLINEEENCVRSRGNSIRNKQSSLTAFEKNNRSGLMSAGQQNENVQKREGAKYLEIMKKKQTKENRTYPDKESFVPEGWITEEKKAYKTGTQDAKTFKDHQLKELPRSATGIKKRVYICALAFMNYTFYLLLRSNIIVGMDAMINNTAVMNGSSDTNEAKSNKILGIDEEPIEGEYTWSIEVQSMVIISFYWGYVLTNIPGGMLAETYGSKHLLTFGLLVSGICMMLVPFAASIDPTFLIIIRFIMGFAQGPSNPATHSILALWIPENERARYTTIAFSGTTCGIMLSDSITGLLDKYVGYEANSYILGSVTILWAIVWERFFSDLPENYKGISEDEKHYLVQCRKNSKPNLRTPPTPWRHIILSVPVWAAVLSQALFEWYFYTYKTHFPTYISDVIGLEGTAGGLMFTVSSSLTFVTNCLIGVKSDTRIKNGTVSTTKQRKQATLFFQWGSALFLAAICYCDIVGAFVPLFLLLSLCTGGTSAGYLVNYIDLAPNYAGTLVAIGNTFTTGLTLGAHECFKALLQNPNLPILERWHSVIWICIVVTFLGGVIFLIYGSGQQQKWNNPDNIKDKLKQTNRVYTVDV